MRMKNEISGKESRKMTEKYLYQVLAASICGILLCMSCLAGSTWAWYVVSVENRGVEICTVKPVVEVTVDGNAESGLVWGNGSYLVRLKREKNQDDLNKTMESYVAFTIQKGSETYLYWAAVTEVTEFTLKTSTPTTVSWTVSGFVPDGAQQLDGNVVDLFVESEMGFMEETVAPTEETTQPTEAATNPPEETTQPTETTMPTEPVPDDTGDGT